MRNYRLFLPTISSLLFLGSCSSDIDEPSYINSNDDIRSHRVSIEDALKRAEMYLSDLDDNYSVRSSKKRLISEIKCLTGSSLTRSSGVDTLLYLINYANQDGFVLLSADNRTIPIYAISNTGALNLEDTVFNKGLQLFYNNAISDVKAMSLGTTPIDPGWSLVDNLYRNKIVRPKLTKYQRSINQLSPYNKYSFNQWGDLCYVGCTPLAIEMVMSYFKHPVNYDGYNFDWEAMNNGDSDDSIARFVSLLGQKKNLNTTYAPVNSKKSSTSHSANIKKTFENLGYTVSPLEYLTTARLQDVLDSHPILVGGSGDEYDSYGHSWVIDGYIRYGLYTNIETGPMPGRIPPYYFFHCAWGWGGSSDGYYFYADYEPISGDPKDYDDTDDKVGGNVYYNHIDLSLIHI